MTHSSIAAPRRGFVPFLPLFLFRAEGSKAVYVLKAWLLVLIPSILLSLAVNVSLPSAEGPDLPVSRPMMVPFIALIGPFLETMIMAVILIGLRRFMAAGPAVLTSALLWGLAHSWAAAIWGLVVWWPFLIFSIAFLTWRERGFWTAILLVTAIHALQNSFAVAVLLWGRQAVGVH